MIRRLLLMAALHLVVMYFVMFTMIDGLGDFRHNLNMLYMAGMMTAPMLLIEAALMGSMYENKRGLAAVVVASVVVFGALFLFVRKQTAIGDLQFIRSMIPHHSGAILMCREATIEDAELRELCRTITEGQRREIEQMSSIMQRLAP